MTSLGPHHPDAHAFLPPRVDIARMLDRHARIRGVHAADVLVLEALARADEYFEQRPFAGR